MYVPKQYDSAKAFLRPYNTLGNITDPMDIMRCNSYALYDDLYFNRPETFAVTLRGDSDVEIYLPSVRKMVDATARFLACDFDFTVKGGAAALVEAQFRKLFKREAIQRKFVQSKKSGLRRGDAVWYITADPNKPAGERISVHTLHPSSYFPIEDINNTERVVGVHLVDIVHDPRDSSGDRTKQVARRQTYRKEDNGRISWEVRTFEIGGWDDRNLSREDIKPVSIVVPKVVLPEAIKTIPVYLVTNNQPEGSSFGISQISGAEYIVNALNQSVTYEDLSLVLQGLGVYVSTAGPPKTPDGKDGKFKMHPGNVIEISGDDTFERVTGVNSVAPFQEHMKFLDTYMGDCLGIPDMAQGTVDVAVAQSGIALALKMGPIIAENQDKELTLQEVWNHIGYDLINGWFPAYEGIVSPDTEFDTTFGDPMPVDRAAKVNEIIQFKTAGLLLLDECRKEMEKLGYPYNSAVAAKLLDEQGQQAIAASGDAFLMEAGANSPSMMDALSSSGTNGSSISSKVKGK